MTTNTPEVKTFTWEQLTLEPGLYHPLGINTKWSILVLDNKYDESDCESCAITGDYKEPEVILLYHRELQIFDNLSPTHHWFKQIFIKVPETIIIRN